MWAYCGWMLAFFQTVWAMTLYRRWNLSEAGWLRGLCARVVLFLLHWSFESTLKHGPGLPNWELLLFAMWAWFDVVFIAAAMSSRKCGYSSSATESGVEMGQVWTSWLRGSEMAV